ncbi:MAG TPA: hypothetical protein VKK79_03275, partial [Candidatus Lokiarchaeia archaeon]|nr:hypothetical protein [Candidatus Lokiarchaeia archaeon]
AVENIEWFPFFKVNLTFPQYFQWIREYSPHLWDRIKAAVSNGVIELTGGCWVEPDIDIPWSESLVQQRLYGQLFYLPFLAIPAFISPKKYTQDIHNQKVHPD